MFFPSIFLAASFPLDSLVLADVSPHRRALQNRLNRSRRDLAGRLMKPRITAGVAHCRRMVNTIERCVLAWQQCGLSLGDRLRCGVVQLILMSRR